MLLWVVRRSVVSRGFMSFSRVRIRGAKLLEGDLSGGWKRAATTQRRPALSPPRPQDRPVGVDGEQPGGTHTIETTEEPIDSLSFGADECVSTTIALPAVGTATLRDRCAIEPKDLEAAQNRDAQARNREGDV
jgi:hypothetical protein